MTNIPYKINSEFVTVLVKQTEFDLYSNQNIIVLSDDTKIPEKLFLKMFKAVQPVGKFKEVEVEAT